MSYDVTGRPTALGLPGGVTESYTYDAASLLTAITHTRGATTLGNLTCQYDAAGNRTQVGGSFARTSLPDAVSTASYNAGNQLTQWGSSSLTYDLNGNLTSDGTNSYTWNARGQLVSMSGFGIAASFQYDGLGRRVRKTANGVITDFVYDDKNVVQGLSGGPLPQTC